LVLFYLAHRSIPQGYHLGWKYNEIGIYGDDAKQTDTKRSQGHGWIKYYLMILHNNVA